MGSAAVQGQLWGRAAHDWAELQEPTALPLWAAMLDAAAVGPGVHVLDAGCGAGGASTLAAHRGAQVNGLDAAEALLAIARAWPTAASVSATWRTCPTRTGPSMPSSPPTCC